MEKINQHIAQMISQDTIKKYYEENPEGIPGTPNIPEIYQAHQLFIKNIQNINPQKTLDAGCGKGYLGEAIRSYTKEYTGFDISSSAVEIAKDRIKDAVFKTGSVLELPFGDESFDCVICSEVLEHVPSYGKAIQELFRVTKKGGTVLISTPNRINPDMIWRILVYGKYTPQIFDKPIFYKKLKKSFIQNGFTIKVFKTFFFLPIWGESMPKFLKIPLMKIQEIISKITDIPLGLYLFFRLKKP